MNATTPPHRSRIIAIALVSVIVGAALGTYLVFYLPQAGKNAGHGFAVDSNRVVLVKLPGFNYSVGIWDLQMSNSGNTTVYVNYLIRANGNIAYGNSSKLQPSQKSAITACITFPFMKIHTYEVSIFVTNSSGVSSSDYPLTFINSTQTQFSGQFSSSSSLKASAHNSQFRGNLSNWSLMVSNSDSKPIQFLYAELWNSTTLLSVFPFLCAGGYVQQTPHAQALAPGQSVNGSTQLVPIATGEAYKVYVVAFFSDFSEVIQTYEVRPTA